MSDDMTFGLVDLATQFVIRDGDAQLIVAFGSKGEIAIGSTYTKTDAAKAFWRAVASVHNEAAAIVRDMGYLNAPSGPDGVCEFCNSEIGRAHV